MYRFAVGLILYTTFQTILTGTKSNKYVNPSSLGELNKEKRGQCPSTFFSCGEKCIKQEDVCDTMSDCIRGEDELQNCPTDCSGRNQFKCTNGQCIPRSYRCDGERDCADSSDEKRCDQTCPPGQFKCDNSHCMTDAWVCDGHNDCGDNSDEVHCSCSTSQFSCKNGRCLSKHFVCDNEDDCGDRSDEEGCTCGSSSFQCTRGKCIPLIYKCDGDNDCGDMSDEANCPDIHPGACADVMTFEDCLRMNTTTFPICATYADAHRFCRKYCKLCKSR